MSATRSLFDRHSAGTTAHRRRSRADVRAQRLVSEVHKTADPIVNADAVAPGRDNHSPHQDVPRP